MVYYILHKGITGVREGIPLENIVKLEGARRFIDKPIAAGFGISRAAEHKDIKGIIRLCKELSSV